ncbi:hypothetical protein C8R43DRAFT_952764 [Mycena crocata]|nr:hypothetical protein C8R43DRAFT_952764 [Mycena crocata]
MALDECFMLLRRILTTPDARISFECAVQDGILPAIMACATLGCAEDINHHLRHLLKDLLPGSLVHYYVVIRLPGAMDDALEWPNGAAFLNFSTAGLWDNFVALAKERISLQADTESGRFGGSKACDNMECGRIQSKRLLDRCSGCKAMYYCSRNCQKIDWKEGGHRTSWVSKLLVRERIFLRALIQRDYEANRHEIMVKQNKFMAENPACLLVLTLFNYCSTPLDIQIAQVSIVGFSAFGPMLSLSGLQRPLCRRISTVFFKDCCKRLARQFCIRLRLRNVHWVSKGRGSRSDKNGAAQAHRKLGWCNLGVT